MIKNCIGLILALCLYSCKTELPPINSLEQGDIVRAGIHFYTDSDFYTPGDSAKIYLDSKSEVVVSLYNKSDTSLHAQVVLESHIQPHSTRDFIDGCNWEASGGLTLPYNLKNGIYFFSAVSGEDSTTYPVVVSKSTKSKTLVLASTNTWQAYNHWGGGSFYKLDTSYSEYGKVSTLINFSRPNPYANAGSHLAGGEIHLIRWLEQNEYDFDLMSDAVFETSAISKYETIVLNCHNEYWTDAMHRKIMAFIEGGGNVLGLGGNLIYARVTRSGDQLEFHEHGDPHIHDGSKGGRWRELDKPESAILGVQYERPLYNTFDSYRVIDPNHWVFSDLDVSKSTVFGSFSVNRGKACGHELDYSNEFSPLSTEIIAKGLNGLEFEEGEWIVRKGAGEIVVGRHDGGGLFFSVGSITFTGSLYSDQIASGILNNVMREVTKQK